MPQVIGVLNQKGGAGKTTISTGLSSSLAEAGYNVLLLDADPQGSALAWSAVRSSHDLPSKFSVLGMPHGSIHKEIERVSKGYDFVVIDAPPRVDLIAVSAIMASDIVVIPVQPSPYDIWAAEDIVNMVRKAQVYKPMLKCTFVINRKIFNTNMGKEVHEALAKYEYPVLNQAIYNRVAYAEAPVTGKSQYELDPEGITAKEMEAVTAETLDMLNKE